MIPVKATVVIENIRQNMGEHLNFKGNKKSDALNMATGPNAVTLKNSVKEGNI